MTISLLPAGLAGLVLCAFPLPDPNGEDGGLVFDSNRRTVVARSEWRFRADMARTRGIADRRTDYFEALTGLAIMRMYAGDKRTGYACMTEAARLLDATPDREDSDVWTVESNLSILSEATGRFSEAERHHANVRQADIRLKRDNTEARVRRLSYLARLYATAGRDGWSELVARRALALDPEAKLFAGLVAWNYGTLAGIYTKARRLDDARQALDAADRLAEFGKSGFDLQRAEMLIAAGKYQEAGPTLRRSLDDPQTRHPHNRASLAGVRVVFAAVVAREGDTDRAKLMLTAAIRHYSRTVGPRGPDYVRAVAEYERLFPADRADVADHVAAIRAAARDEELKGPEWVLGGPP